MSYTTKPGGSAASIKDVDGKKGIITGYFAVFGNVDSDGDLILPGAFLKTIAERGPQSAQPRVKFLRNHLVYEPVGNITELKEDSNGLYYEGVPGTHFIGTDTVKMIQSGLITEHSFGFETLDKNVKSDGTRELKELRLWEGSVLTAWGANEKTGAAALKSLGKEAYIDKLRRETKALETFCRNTTATDETIELLLLERKQLTQMILDLSEKATGPEQNSTLPDAIGQTLDDFIKSLKN